MRKNDTYCLLQESLGLIHLIEEERETERVRRDNLAVVNNSDH